MDIKKDQWASLHINALACRKLDISTGLPILFLVITLIIMELFISKMCRLLNICKILMVIEEA